MFSKDKECRILGIECLRPFVSKIFDGFNTQIWLTDGFEIKPMFSGLFELSTGGITGAKIIYKIWKESVSKNSQQE